MPGDALIIDKISKNFGNLKAVDSLSASLPAGCIYGFLGPNGAGKTTTIRMIMDIIRPDSGQVRVLGESLIERVRDRIGYMPEERGLYRKMTVRGMIAYIGTLHGMSKVELDREIPRWLDELELSDWVNNKVEELSRGMQQKLQFIVTVINGPELLILDEPFAGLDPLNLDRLKDIVLKLREEGRTVIFSTHMMEQAEKLCDYILLINKGEKVIDGTLEQVRAQYKSNTVLVELEGNGDFIEKLPMVAGAKKDGRKLDVSLVENTDPQEFLKAIVDKTRVLSFEVRVPSLHEIFVHLVGGKADE
jgi:ABC-2 type transport system ATP-binding protein